MVLVELHNLCCYHCAVLSHCVGALFALGFMQYVAVNSHICAHSCHEKVIFNMSRISGVGGYAFLCVCQVRVGTKERVVYSARHVAGAGSL
jgi:hypothetical protein